ncbi:MAG: hypothetical protein JXR77_10210, partial [Lentisphaeria bacterium]|nr:hypothetical protein [Lentisphaeria bacterium]
SLGEGRYTFRFQDDSQEEPTVYKVVIKEDGLLWGRCTKLLQALNARGLAPAASAQAGKGTRGPKAGDIDSLVANANFWKAWLRRGNLVEKARAAIQRAEESLAAEQRKDKEEQFRKLGLELGISAEKLENVF